MSTYLTSYPQDQWPWGYTQPPYEPPDPAPDPVPNPIVEGNIVQLESYNDGTEDRDLFLSAEDMSIDYPPGARIIGHWSNDGTAQVSVLPEYDIIRPFGNGTSGVATDRLDFHHFQGHAQRDVQEIPVPETMAKYHADNQPIILTMDRWYDDTPGFEGEGWKATIEFSDPTRPPNARAIGIYDENWIFEYTTGSFIETQVGTDPDTGDPIMKWQTHTPPGFATPTKEPIYYALLLGSEQEGRFKLDVEDDSVVRHFWESEQVIPVGESWVDSGATTDGMAGTVTLVSDVAPFSVGSQVRIDGVEMAVTSIWNTQGLELDPYQVSATGLPIEVWQ